MEEFGPLERGHFFLRCRSLMGVQLPGVRIIEMEAFKLCDDF